MNLEETILRCNLELKLDNNTEGYGNCFPNAIIQQCRRPEIKAWLQNRKPWATASNYRVLRTKITNFALEQKLKAIVDLKSHHNKEIKNIEKKSWLDYWKNMEQEGIWVEHLFVQMTAWYFELDINILTTSSKLPKPFIVISGNANQIPNFVSGPPILIGNYTNIHYQSLVPTTSKWRIEEVNCSTSKKKTKVNNESEESKSDEFKYIENNNQITFTELGDGKFECPFCTTKITD